MRHATYPQWVPPSLSPVGTRPRGDRVPNTSPLLKGFVRDVHGDGDGVAKETAAPRT